MCEGDIISFLHARRFFEDFEMKKAFTSEEGKETLIMIYPIRSFIFEVLANLGGDTMFGFPSENSYIGIELMQIVKNTGFFLKNSLEKGNLSENWKYFSKALILYYNLLGEINEFAEKSDLLDLEDFTPKRIDTIDTH